MNFEKFEELVIEEFVEGILKSFSPQIDYRHKYKGHFHLGFKVGVSTKTCRFLFVWEEGGGVMIGPKTSNFANTNNGWFSLDRIICFVSGEPFIEEAFDKNIGREEKIILTFRYARKALTPYLHQVMLMFSSKAKICEWSSQYEKYENKQFKLRYPAFYDDYIKRKNSNMAS